MWDPPDFGLYAVTSLNWHCGSLEERQSLGFLLSGFPLLFFAPIPLCQPAIGVYIFLTSNPFGEFISGASSDSRGAAFPLLCPPTTSLQ